MSDDHPEKKDRKKPKSALADFLGIKRKEVTEEEILSLVDVGEESGTIHQNEKNRIENIFDFRERTASEIMTHRTDIIALEDTADFDEAVNMALDTGYSRIPVYHEDIDDIIGVLYVKDLLRFVGDNRKEFNLSKIVRSVPVVPKSKKCERLFALMTEQKVQMAVVVDEYGGTEGVITLEDLVELILGNIQDEFDDEDEDIKRLGSNAFAVDGMTPVEDIEELLGTSLNAPEDCDTLAAFILEHLGRIPQTNEHPVVNINNLTFTVSEIDERRISKVIVVKND